MNQFSAFARLLILLGIIFVILGAVFSLAGKVPFIGKLPGDFYIKKGNFQLYFPLTTCLLISAIISLILFFISRK